MEWGAPRARMAGKAGSGGSSLAGSENVRMLTADMFGMVRKRRKILPASALRGNSSHAVWCLERTYRFYCSASGRWVVADEVAYDEKLGTFQSVKEYSRAIRPRNGMKQEINFWPQLGVGQVKYKELAAAPSNPFNNPAAAFIPSTTRPANAPAPAPTPGYVPLPTPDPVFDGMFSDTASAVNYTDLESHGGMFADGTTVADQSTAFDGETERGDGSSVFGGGTEATSVVGDRQSAYEAATDHGSTFDTGDTIERLQARVNPNDRVGKLANLVGIDRAAATVAINEFDRMPSIPKKGAKDYSKWMSEFSSKHGFKPDILVNMARD